MNRTMPYLPWLLVPLLSIVLLAPTWQQLLTQWMHWDQIMSHGLPTFALFLILILLHPPLLQDNKVVHSQSLTAGLTLVAVMLLWTLMKIVNIDLFAALLVPVIMASLVWLLFGFSAAKSFLPYLVVFSLALPFWGDLVPVLVRMASVVVGTLVGQLGMTALIEGHSITLPWGRMVIVDGCSGIRYLAVGVLLSALVALLNDYGWRGWLVCLSVAVTLALLVNWVRITGLVIIGYQTQMESSLMDSHELYGWLIFAAASLPALFLTPIKRRTERVQIPRVPLNQSGVVFLALALLAGPALLWAANRSYSTGPYWVFSHLDQAPASGQGQPMALQLPPEMVQNHYRMTNPSVWVHTAQFQRRNPNDKLVPYLGNTIDTERWQRQLRISVVESSYPVDIYRNAVNQRRVAQLQWYRVGSMNTASYRTAKLQQIPSVLRNENHFSLITLQTQCSSLNCEDEARVLQDISVDLQAELPQ